MGRKSIGNEDWCPECGHLMPKNSWNCPFCGWSLQDLQMNDFELDSWDDYSDINDISISNRDIDRLIDNL